MREAKDIFDLHALAHELGIEPSIFQKVIEDYPDIEEAKEELFRISIDNQKEPSIIPIMTAINRIKGTLLLYSTRDTVLKISIKFNDDSKCSYI